MLTNLTVATELFHAADETAFADIMIEGHRETWPIRRSRFRLWLRRKYYEATGGSPSRTVASTWTLPKTIGARSRSTPMGGGSSPVHRSDSAGRRACCRCQCR